MIKKLSAKTENDMLSLGGRVAGALKGGEFIALFGGLGAGKTTFVKGLAAALQIDGISSPTFNIVKRHKGRLQLDHFDCYRLADHEELLAIGFEDYLTSGSVIVMEWSELVIDALPNERLEIHISGSGSDERTVEIVSFGSRYDSLPESI